MRPAQCVSRLMSGCATPPALAHLRRRRPTHHSDSSEAFALTLCGPSRRLSQQASRWVDKMRYGAEDAPSLGSWENAYEDDAMDTRKLYCKALVHASGGSRLARDWIAGCAALTSPDPSLIYTALQHTATAEDVEALREHFLARLLARDAAPKRHRAAGDGDLEARWRGRALHQRTGENTPASYEVAEEEDEVEREVLRDGEEVDRSDCFGSSAATPTTAAEVVEEGGRPSSASGAAAASVTPPESSTQAAKQAEERGGGDDAECDDAITPDALREAEFFLLSRSPEVRCFMYDAMTASLFHSNYDLRTVEAARRHTFWIGANVFGISFDELTLLWRVVEAELLLKKEKIKVLGQPWSE